MDRDPQPDGGTGPGSYSYGLYLSTLTTPSNATPGTF